MVDALQPPTFEDDVIEGNGVWKVQLFQGNTLMSQVIYDHARDANGFYKNDTRYFNFSYPLANGTYQLYVRAFTESGTSTDSPTKTVVVTGQAPSVMMQHPGNGAGSTATAPSLTGGFGFEAYASGNGATVTKLEVLNGTNVVATFYKDNIPSGTTVGGFGVGEHQVRVRVTDHLNQTALSQASTVTVVPPSPEATISSPISGSKYGLDEDRSYATVTFTGIAKAYSPAAISKIEVFDDGVFLERIFSNQINTYFELGTGTHWLNLKVTDTMGRVVTSPTALITVGGSTTSGESGSATLSAPTSGTYSTSGTTFAINVSGSATPSHFASVRKIELLDGGSVIATSNSNTINTTVQLAVGTHVLSLRSTDSFNNIGTSGTATVTIKAGVPTGTLSSPVTNSTMNAAGNSHPVNFVGNASASATYSVAKIELMEQSTVLATAYGSSINTTVTLPAGPHAARLRVTDSGGQVGLGPEISYMIQAAPVNPVPTLSVVRSPSKLTSGQNYTATWTTTNATSVAYSCTADGTGMSGSAAGLAPNSSLSGTAQASWVNFPTTCNWTAQGPGGNATFSEVMTTTALAAPNLSVVRTPSTVIQGNTYTVTWATSNANSVAYNCTTTGSGMSGGASSLALNGSISGTASSAWVGYPTTCTWTASGPGGTTTKTETMTTVKGTSNAQFVSQTMTPSMTAGRGYDMSVTMKNTGDTIWTSSGTNAFRLGAVGDSMLWGLKRVELPHSVETNGTVTFNFRVNAPPPGDAMQNWQMLQEFVAWFGATATQPVTVTAPSGNPPTLAISSPVNLNHYQGSGATGSVAVAGTAVAYDGAAVTKIEVWEGSTLLATTNASSIDASITLTAGVNHTITSRAFDNYGRVSIDNQVNVFVDYPPPLVAVMTLPANYVEQYSNGTTPNVRVTAFAAPANGLTVSRLELYNTDGLVTSFPGGSVDQLIYLPNGFHSLKVRAVDSAGQAGPFTTYATFSVSNAPVPQLTVKRTPHVAYVGQNYSVKWDSTYATSVSYTCSATNGGMQGSGTVSPVATGIIEGTALLAWVNNPSTCVWTATGLGGTVTATETMTTTAQELPKPLASLISPTVNMPAYALGGAPNVRISGYGTVDPKLDVVRLLLLDFGVQIHTFNTSVVDEDIVLALGAHDLKLVAVDSIGRQSENNAVAAFTVSPALLPKFVSLTRTPMVAGADYTVSWVLENANYLYYSCRPIDGEGMSESGFAPLASGGSFTRQANHVWVNHPSTCTWTARGVGGETVFIESPVTTSPSALPIPPGIEWKNIGGISFQTVYVKGTSPVVALELKATPGIDALIDRIELYDNGVLVSTLPGGTTTFNFSVVAGKSYSLKLRAIDNFGQQSYDFSPTLQFSVALGFNDAAFVEQQQPAPLTGGVATIVAGSPFTATIKMRNTGVLLWSDDNGVDLTSVAAGSPEWVPGNKVAVGGQTASTEYKVFTITGRAPDIAGDYHYQWQMSQRESGVFGEKTPDILVRVTPGAALPSVFALTATPKNAWVGTGQKAAIKVAGSATVGTGRIVKLELLDRTGNAQQGYSELILHTVVKGPLTDGKLDLGYTASLAPGDHGLKLRATNSAGYITISEPMSVSVTDTGNVLGRVKGVRTDVNSTPRLVGWACEYTRSAPLAYKVYRNAWPSQGGIQIASGSANLNSERDSSEVRANCDTPDASHGFSVDLVAASNASPTGIPAGTSLFVTVLVDGAERNLPCEDGNCVMPDSLRVGLATPEDEDQYMGPANVFMQAKVAGGTVTADQITFDFDGQGLVSSADSLPNTFMASKGAVAARAAPYLVYAKVVRDGKALYTLENRVYVRTPTSLTLNLTGPAAGTPLIVGAPVPLKVAMGGDASAVSEVRFYYGRVLLGVGKGDRLIRTYNWDPAISKLYGIRARAFDSNRVLLAESREVTFVIGSGATSEVPVPIAITDYVELTSSTAGSLQGSLTVNSGAAGYSIPIAAPPGTNGMVPAVSLNYSSDNTTGSAGLGWSVGGLSNIDRCGLIVATDSKAEAVRMNSADRLCLDGQRLVLVNGDAAVTGAYWAQDAEYRTEIDSFVRVVGLGPITDRTFAVYQRNGNVAFYGETANSRVADTRPQLEGGTGLAHRWRLARVTDPSTNYMTIAYTVGDNGENKPQKIRWGGNLRGATPQIPYAALDFTYSPRPDVRHAYVAGSPTFETQILTKIVTSTDTDADGKNGTVAHTYNLTHDTSPTSGRKRLTAVELCSSSGCLPKTNFIWGNPRESAENKFVPLGAERDGPRLADIQTNISKGPMYAIISGDFNGDGKTDLLERAKLAGNNQQQRLYQSNASGTGWTVSTPLSGQGSSLFIVTTGDFDGDGSTDLLVADGDTSAPGLSQPRICKWIGNAFSCGAVLTSMPGDMFLNWGEASNSITSRDVNADGKDDLVIEGSSSPVTNAVRPRYLCMANGSSFDCNSGSDTGVFQSSLNRQLGGGHATADVNGDGRVDQLMLGRCKWTKLASQQFDHWICPEPATDDQDNFYGLSIIGAHEPGTPPFLADWYKISKLAPAAVLPPRSGGTITGDLNADGYTDVVFDVANLEDANIFPVSKRGHICYSKGDGKSDCKPLPDQELTHFVLSVGDFDGDGALDVLRVSNESWSASNTTKFQLCRVVAGGTSATEVCKPWDGNAAFFAREGKKEFEGTIADKDVTSPRSEFLGDFNGDGRTDFITYLGSTYNGGNKWQVFTPGSQAKEGQVLDKLVSVTNGLGKVDRVVYAAANDAAADGTRVYQAEGSLANAAPIPLGMDAKRSPITRNLVERLVSGNGGSRSNVTTFKYYANAVSATGRGSLGFARVDSTDDDSKIVSSIWTRQDYPFVGMTSASQTARSGCVLNAVENLYKEVVSVPAKPVKFVYLRDSTQKRKDLDCTDMGEIKTHNIYDDDAGATGIGITVYGNLTSSEVTTTLGSEFKSTTVTSYDNKITSTRWQLGLPLVSTVTKTTPLHTGTRTATRTYNSDGLIASEIRNTGADVVTTTFFRKENSFGLVDETTLGWTDPATNSSLTRSSSVTFDARGRFPLTTKNAAGHTETRTFDSRTGAPTSATSANQLKTTMIVDGFGRTTRVHHPDGSIVLDLELLCDASCPAEAATMGLHDVRLVDKRIAVPVLTYRDSAGHVLQNATWGFDGRKVVTNVRYDAQGREYEVDRPRFAGDISILAKRSVYDDLDRVTHLKTLDEKGDEVTAENHYRGPVTELVNAKGQTRIDTRDGWNRVVASRDPMGEDTLFEYDAFDNLTKTIDPAKNEVKIAYNDVGQRIRLNDPDLGEIRYDVDPLGQVWRQVSPKQSNTTATTYKFDTLGRMTERNESDLTSRWIYDAPIDPAAPTQAVNCSISKRCGMLVEANSTTNGTKDYVRTHSFDTFGRPVGTTVLQDVLYTSTIRYDLWGRPVNQAHERTGNALKEYGLRYNAYGYLARIERGLKELWAAEAQDAAGRVTDFALGNGLKGAREHNLYTGQLEAGSLNDVNGVRRLEEGYQYDVLGNVTLRSQHWMGTDGFIEMFRYDDLNRLKESAIGAGIKTYTYDKIGNIVSKSDVSVDPYIYPASGAASIRPHAVKSIGANVYEYDANGNLTSGGGRTVSWSSFDMPKTITLGGNSSSFIYGPEHQRVRQTKGGGGTIRYAGAMEFEENGATWKLRTYWPNGVGMEVDSEGVDVPTTLTWTHADRLGSTVAISGVDGELMHKMAFDAWGMRRELNGNTTSTTLDGAGIDNKGYTGHEMLDELDLVHMNGRVYDPRLARFMSADAIIQDPMHSQSYNRYTYVWNNPTNMVDPTGFIGLDVNAPVQKDEKECDRQCRQNKEDIRRGRCGYLGVICDSERSRKETVDDTGGQSDGHAAGMVTNVLDGINKIWAQANRAFGVLDFLNPSRASFESGVTQQFYGPCFENCGEHNYLVKVTADVWQENTRGVLEAGNRYYPELAKNALLSAVPIEAIAVKQIELVREILMGAKSMRGNFNIGSFTRTEMDMAGLAWVGPGARPMMKNDVQIGWTSADSLKTYRFPELKGGGFAAGRTQGNLTEFIRLSSKKTQVLRNAHMDLL
jgi:RHS repeat-associated protein